MMKNSTASSTESRASSVQGTDGSRRSTAASTESRASTVQGTDGSRRSTAASAETRASSDQLERLPSARRDERVG
uniref:Uncharacterized protein n=1 Tax=Trichuris muris TaxID=70415 RepID=A0A5S6QJP3_TRIMR